MRFGLWGLCLVLLGCANPAPKLSFSLQALTATPSSSVAPFEATFTWNLSSLEAKLTCDLDVDGDKQFEYHLEDCGGQNSQTHTYAKPGAYYAQLQVTSNRGEVLQSSLKLQARENSAPKIETFAADPAQGLAPLSTQIRWKVSDADGDALSCGLDIGGDGSLEYNFPNCPATNAQGHRFEAIGDYPVVLRLSDRWGSTVEQRLNLKAEPDSTQPTNQAPQILSFVATPSSGYAPLNTRFGWQIADPEQSSLTCKLDTDNNGSIEYTLPACDSSSTQAHLYKNLGNHTARLVVEDGQGGASSRTLGLNVTADPSGPDLRISRVEWAQSVVKRHLKLVSGKPALLRVYVLADRSGLATSVQAQVYLSGVYMGEVRLSGPTTVPTAEDMGVLNSTYNGTVPAQWVGAGLEVRLRVDPENNLPERDESNNAATNLPALMTQGNLLYLTTVPVRYIDTGAANTLRTPTLPSNFGTLLTDLFPVKEVQVQPRVSYTFTGNLRNAADWSRLLSEVRNLAVLDGSQRYYYGIVKPGYSSGIVGMGYVGWPYAVGWDAYPSEPYRDDSAAWVMAHEIGHNFGRDHATCGVNAPDPSYPYANAQLGTWGYSTFYSALKSPSSFKDVMSYCNPQWISDYTYVGIQDYLEAKPPKALLAQTQSQTLLFVSGQVSGSAVRLSPLLRLETQPSPPSPGDYRLRYLSNGVWKEQGFSTQRIANPHTAPSGTPEEHFAFTLPNPGPISRLEVWRAQAMLHATDLPLGAQSAQDPSLSHVESAGELHIGWLPAVYPYLSVAHLGSVRTTLALSLRGGQATLSTQDLPSGGRFELVLSDGLNSRRWEVVR